MIELLKQLNEFLKAVSEFLKLLFFWQAVPEPTRALPGVDRRDRRGDRAVEVTRASWNTPESEKPFFFAIALP